MRKPKPNVPPAPAPELSREDRFDLAVNGVYTAICEHFARAGFDAPNAEECRRIAEELLLCAHLHCDEGGACWQCVLQAYLEVEGEVAAECDAEQPEGPLN